MTGIQEIQDEILGLEALIAGRRMELAMAQGERDTAPQHKNAMYAAIHKRREFRINTADEHGQCFFDAQGAADRLVIPVGV